MSDLERRPNLTVRILDGFAVECHSTGEIEHFPSIPSRRLVGYLALSGRFRSRAEIAAELWPDSAESAAHQSVRSALFAVRRQAPQMIIQRHDLLRLADGIDVDLTQAYDLSERVDGLDVADCARAIGTFKQRLLPGWYDEWVGAEQERWNEVRVRALEAISARLSDEGRHQVATLAARIAVRAEPLREPSRSSLIRAYLAEGDAPRAIVEYRRFHRLLREELGASPSRGLASLVEHLATVPLSVAIAILVA